MKIIFLGTPAFAVPTLEKLITHPSFQVVALVSQPDRPAGRGGKISVPPTKQIALQHGIPVLQPERLSKSPEIVQTMRDLKPDVLVTAAFGQILKEDVLNLAPHKVINLHASLLPKYRGAAPINWALIKGEKTTGITTMISDVGIDTGMMLLKKEIDLDENINAAELADKLSTIGAALMIETLTQIANNTISPIKQDDSQATLAPRLSRELGKIDWSKPAVEIHNLVRGLIPWPAAYTSFHDTQVKILETAISETGGKAQPGSVKEIGKKLFIACGQDGQETLEIISLQQANKARMKACDWAHGQRLTAGSVLQ